jgi:hypothetical protein
VVLRERMMRPRNSSWLYNHAVETPASAATVRKLISDQKHPFAAELPRPDALHSYCVVARSA